MDEQIRCEWLLVMNATSWLNWPVFQHEHDFGDTSPECFFIQICSADDNLHGSFQSLDNEIKDASKVKCIGWFEVPFDATRILRETKAGGFLNCIPVDCLVPLCDLIVSFLKGGLVVRCEGR